MWKLFQTKEKTGESIYSLDRSEEFRKVVETVLEGRHGDSILKLQGGHVRLIANPVYREGETVGAVLLLVDVTEQVERETLRREDAADVYLRLCGDHTGRLCETGGHKSIRRQDL